MAKSTLKLKNPVNSLLSPKAGIPVSAPKSRKAKVIDFTGHRPAARAYGQRVKSETPNFEAIFGFKPSTTGEHITILRAHMHLEGMPPIPEDMKIVDFANIFARFVLPRRAWPFFSPVEEHDARDFIREWSSALLPQIADKRKAKAQPWLHRDMIPEIAALYNPVYFDRGVSA